jgi:hypothetical protein
MPKSSPLMEVVCPCCEAKLKIDPVTTSVITYEEKRKPAPVEDFQAAIKNLKGEAAKRDAAFERSVAANRNQQEVLGKKFDELLKKAKTDPTSGPPKKPFDFD